jgi:two-component system sensor histidine kinase/response regulator
MGKQQILVVDDREALLAAIRDILEIEGYTILTATNGMKALEVMEETRPDLIVADILMPQMDGYAFYEAVRARQEWTSIPFIFLTAKAEREDVSKGMDLGAEEYITKPFDPQELLQAVRARLEPPESHESAV